MFNFKIDSPTGKNLGNFDLWFPIIIFGSDNVLNYDYLLMIKSLT